NVTCVNGSSDTSHSSEASALLDDLPPGIAWLLGPNPRLPAPAPPGSSELDPGRVLTWLPDGRWVTDPDQSDPDADEPGSGREGPGHDRGRSMHRELGPGRLPESVRSDTREWHAQSGGRSARQRSSERGDREPRRWPAGRSRPDHRRSARERDRPEPGQRDPELGGVGPKRW